MYNPPEKEGALDERPFFEFRGGLVSVVLPRPGAQVGGGERERITIFSRASRLRLLKMAASLQFEQAKFVTLTFSGIPTPQKAKDALRRFAERLRRRWPSASYVWRMEPQRRGAPHFHLLLFGVRWWPQRSLQATWEACTGEERSIAHIQLIRSDRQLRNYVSKYLAKVDVPPPFDSGAYLDNDTYLHADTGDTWIWPGRWWGVHNRSFLPYFPQLLIRVPYGAHIWQFKRAMRRKYAGVNRGRRGGTVFVTNAYQWSRYLGYLIATEA